MIKTYLHIAWRNLLNKKNYFALNILGLSVGITACLLIGLSVSHETGFDKQIPDQDRVYRLNEYMHYQGAAPQLSAAIGPPIAPFLKDNHGEIESYTRVLPAAPFIYPSITLEYNGNKIRPAQMACTDTSFANMFGVDIIEGNKNDFVRDQNTIVLTKELAYKLFGNKPALHKTVTLRVNDTVSYSLAVSNVVKDFPVNTHLRPDALIPVPSFFIESFLGTNYGVLMGPSYIRLKPNTDIVSLQKKLTETLHAKNKFIDMQLQPLSEIHSRSIDINYDYFNYKKVDGKYISLFVIIALSIFVIACCNFVNLTIAIAAYRGKEIAVKKIVGARRVQIVFHVLTETFLAVLASIMLAIIFAGILLPSLNRILDRELEITRLYQWPAIGIYLIVLLSTTLIAGLYPALLISSSKIQNALKTKILFAGSRTSLRNVLVTGQFTIAVVFIVGLIVFLKQLNYMENKNLGYSYEQVIKFSLDVANAEKLDIYRSELKKIKGVTDITNGYLDLGGNGALFGVKYISPDGQSQHVSVNFENAATNYADFFGMKIIAGRDFNKDNPANEYLINETLAKQIGYTDPIGKQIHLADFPPGAIVGVVKDFNYSSLRSKIEPLIISSVKDVPVWQSQLYVKVSTPDVFNVMKEIEAEVKNISGNNKPDWQFLDEHFKQIYAAEKQAGTMVAIMGGLAISIACFGLLSLAAFIIVKRTKEIGIRKVLGASITSIMANLSKEFLRMVVIAFVLAAPISWWLLNNWLQDFAYRIEIQWWMFAIAGLITVGIAFFTVSIISIKAARANPVKSLRSE